ncbi:MAG TPA: VOC family protein [Thermoanaerobaculia bacterium]|nr:VOC family protein [Thermoanaerobaculia bacterium]
MNLLENRSIPPNQIIPELAYPNVSEAAAWLCEAFGFVERLRIGNHRIQLTFGDGALVVTEQRAAPGAPSEGSAIHTGHSTLVRVADLDSHHERAQQSGARIVNPPTDHPYGERQYTAVDLGGHVWTFTQSIADVNPADWGGVLVG